MAWTLAAQGLDQRVIENYTNTVGALLGVQFTAAERATIRGHVEGYWARGMEENKKSVLDANRTWELIGTQDPELAKAALRMSRHTVLTGLSEAAAKGNPDSKFLLDAYYQRYPVIASGKPGGLPLTREMVEAELALKYWMTKEIHRQNAPAPDGTVVENALRAAIAAHSRLSPAEQVEKEKQAGEWARVQYGWARASHLDRLLTIEQMGGPLMPQERMQLQQFTAGLNSQLQGMQQQQFGMLQSTLNNMKQNSETILGRGTVWNPATNRWEQQGGIVTEYNGVVRVP